MLADIIVHMDRGAGCTARLMAAIDLARRHTARLKGLYVVTHPHYASSSDFMTDFEQVRNFFVNAASKAGVVAEWLLVDWAVVGTPLHEIVIRHAYFADTILIGQPAYLRSRKVDLDFHERLILSIGRPIVVFPASGEVFRFGDRIMVAWRGGREAVRAVHDALPFLQQAAQVSVVAVSVNKDQDALEQKAMVELLGHLIRHGIQATAEILALNGSVADTLLDHAARNGIDLVVLGGFAYKPNRAPLLSPLARDLLIRADVPLLLSH